MWARLFSELFGYSHKKGEVEVRRNLQTNPEECIIAGSGGKKGKGDLFVVEAKQGSLAAEKKFSNRPFSYLKLPALGLGILVCDKIFIFGYDQSQKDEEQDFVPIDIENDSVAGSKFVGLFSKENFDKAQIKEAMKKRAASKQDISEIKKTLADELGKKLAAGHFLRAAQKARWLLPCRTIVLRHLKKSRRQAHPGRSPPGKILCRLQLKFCPTKQQP